MALPAVSPRSVAGAQPAFALTRARSSWTLWAGRRGRRARSVQGAVGVPPGGRCRPQSSLGTPASGPALGSGRDVHARRYGGCAEGDLASNLWNGQRPVRPRSPSARCQDGRTAACLGRASPPSHGVWVPDSRCRGSRKGRPQGMGFPFPLFHSTLLCSQVVLLAGL